MFTLLYTPGVCCGDLLTTRDTVNVPSKMLSFPTSVVGDAVSCIRNSPTEL